jgi:bacterioferritin-associated ferredoxin
MYVCLCNGVTDNDVRGSIAAGAGTTREIRAACGMKPGCGICTKRLFAMLSEHRTGSELVDALTGGPRPLEAVPAPRPFEPVSPGPGGVPALPGAPGLPVALGMPAMPTVPAMPDAPREAVAASTAA